MEKYIFLDSEYIAVWIIFVFFSKYHWYERWKITSVSMERDFNLVRFLFFNNWFWVKLPVSLFRHSFNSNNFCTRPTKCLVLPSRKFRESYLGEMNAADIFKRGEDNCSLSIERLQVLRPERWTYANVDKSRWWSHGHSPLWTN